MELAQKQAAPTYFRYTPEGQNSQQRVIKLVEKPVDPFEPPKFKHKKVVRGPGSPPVPIVHSPPRKLTQKDFEEWKIPPCISNWKNQRGLTIALDKRLAADGRGLQKPQINDKFAQFAESLYLAERNAREMVEQRSEINRLTAERDRREKEEALAAMAARARSARTNNYEEEDTDQDRAERDRLREERRKQTEREMRLENLKDKRKRDEDRDISERIALGQAAPTLTGESMFDQRLFNQSQGVSQGFGSEDTYSAFDKPLFQGTSAHQMFRPKKDAEELYGSEADLEALKNTKRFQPDRGFKGAESDGKARRNPVEFERQPGAVQEASEPVTDDFDFLDDYMDEAKTAKMDDALSKTTMSAPRRPMETVPPRPDRSRSPRDRHSPRRRRSPSPRRRSPSPHRRRSPSPRRRSPDRRYRDDRRDRGYRHSPYDRDRHDSRRRSPDRRDYRRSPDRREYRRGSRDDRRRD